MAPCGPSESRKSLLMKEMLVGAVGIENNTDRNSKDVEEMLGSAKTLKRNNRECKGILIGPLKALRFFESLKLVRVDSSPTALANMSASGSNLAARMASRHAKARQDSVKSAAWQTLSIFGLVFNASC
jgi:hypothetical protein